MKLNLSVPLFLFALLPYAAAFATITIDTVPVGNPGNPADSRYLDLNFHPNGVGSVAYEFNIGKTEVTNAKYVAFLNAVAGSDPYGLYDNLGLSGIVRSGSSPSYTYAVRAPALSGTYKYDDKPVVFVSSGDAMRFANWLHNGQPTGAEDASTTEDGAYTLNGATSGFVLAGVSRNSGALWFLPNEDEWYKAAYYSPGAGIYFDYPTGTYSVPNNNPPSGDTGNSANFRNNGYTTGNSSYPLTDAGAYTLSVSPYGTFDQGGNVGEWNETLFLVGGRGIRGGSWQYDYLHASDWHMEFATYQFLFVGFRVASAAVPEPSTAALIGLATAAVCGFRRHRRT